MIEKKVAELFEKKDIHTIGSGLGYGLLTQENAEEIVISLLSTIHEDGATIVDLGENGKVSFSAIISSKETFSGYIVEELKNSFDTEYARVSDLEKGYI